jgi:hypothetical protein
MSNGYYRFARVDTAAGAIYIDQGWGGYADFTINLPSGEIGLTREQYDELLAQMNDYECGGRDSEHEDIGVKS